MKLYTGKDYLYINIANTFGLDKLTFEQRIEWTTNNEDKLEQSAVKADEPLLFRKAVRTLRKAQQGIPTGFLCALDASNSCAQIMSALMGCLKGATATGLIDPDKRADAYKDLLDTLNGMIDSDIHVAREDLKRAFMEWLYGSKATPKEVFGEDSPAYAAFFDAMSQIVPGAVDCREALIHAWRPMAKEHTTTMPDGFTAVLRTQKPTEVEFSLTDIPGSRYNLKYKQFVGKEKGVALVANTIHETDGFVAREMNRRCNYNTNQIQVMYKVLKDYCGENKATCFKKVISIKQLDNLLALKDDMNTLCRLRDLCGEMLQWKTSPLVGIHDSFAATPNNMNKVRYWYKEILAELADSDLLQDLLRQLYQTDNIRVDKEHPDLGSLIRLSNYALT